MKRIYRLLSAAVLTAASASGWAGNIPQYTFSMGGPEALYTEFSDGTPVPADYTGGVRGLFPGISGTILNTTAEGFPIGFDFRYAGQTFDRFCLTNFGDVYLGKGEVSWPINNFHLGMTPIKYGLYKATVSYKTTGAEGNRVLTVQYKNCVLNETGSERGKYNLQIRLYEKDGRIEYAFQEIDTTYSTYMGFDAGLHGWDNADGLQLTAQGLGQTPAVSEATKADMLQTNTYVRWEYTDYDKFYKFAYVFTPCTDTGAPATAPQITSVSQHGNTLQIDVTRRGNAPAMAVLVSDTPFTEADLPQDGITFAAGPGKTLGNARALYYGNAPVVSLSLDDAEPSTTYYVKAISANGYPAWNLTHTDDVRFTTPQAAPQTLSATAKDTKTVDVTCQSDDDIIVAVTDTPVPGFDAGYAGVFGQPAPDAAPGDPIEGGGKVVYAGPAEDFNLEVEPNTLNFLRAWTVRDGIVSATGTDAWVIPVYTLPFAPGVENYPMGMQLPAEWGTPGNQWLPWRRDYDGVCALYGVAANGDAITLHTPPMSMLGDVRLTFDFAMETVRTPETEGGATVLRGNEPGYFGEGGYLKVLDTEGKMLKTVESYSGTMTISSDGYETGSSTFESVGVDLPAQGFNGSLAIAFRPNSDTYIYLKDLRIEPIGELPAAPVESPEALTADETRDATLTVTCTRAADAEITAVLMSETPFTEADLPADGQQLARGQKLGNATVLYYGTDVEVATGTDLDMMVPDYDTDYYFCAIAANGNPLYNRTGTVYTACHTMAEAGVPQGLQVTVEGNKLIVTATRHEAAAHTLIAVGKDAWNGILEDGRTYAEGEKLDDNTTVIYHGGDDAVTAVTHELEWETGYTVTALSANSRGWWGDGRTYANAVTEQEPESLQGVEAGVTITCLPCAVRVNASEAVDASLWDMQGLTVAKARGTSLLLTVPRAGAYLLQINDITYNILINN